jgi:hypothetical protein
MLAIAALSSTKVEGLKIRESWSIVECGTCCKSRSLCFFRWTLMVLCTSVGSFKFIIFAILDSFDIYFNHLCSSSSLAEGLSSGNFLKQRFKKS